MTSDALLAECYEWLFGSKCDGPRVSEGALEKGAYTAEFADLHARLKAAISATPAEPAFERPIDLARKCVFHAVLIGGENRRQFGAVRAAVVTLFGADIDKQLADEFAGKDNRAPVPPSEIAK